LALALTLSLTLSLLGLLTLLTRLAFPLALLVAILPAGTGSALLGALLALLGTLLLRAGLGRLRCVHGKPVGAIGLRARRSRRGDHFAMLALFAHLARAARFALLVALFIALGGRSGGGRSGFGGGRRHWLLGGHSLLRARLAGRRRISGGRGHGSALCNVPGRLGGGLAGAFRFGIGFRLRAVGRRLRARFALRLGGHLQPCLGRTRLFGVGWIHHSFS
jgi:hypothetical protein